MFRSTINTTRNLIFEIFLRDLFYALLSFRVSDLYREHLAQNAVIHEPEEIQRLAHQKAEHFAQSLIKRRLFIATKQHLKTTYSTTFEKFYNMALTSTAEEPTT
jgi:hypothetical protein